MQYGWWLGHHYFAASVNEGENDDADANANIQDEWFLTLCLVSYLAIRSYMVLLLICMFEDIRGVLKVD